MTADESTGAKLRKHRYRRGLKQKRLCQLAGVAQGSLSMWEQGHRVPGEKSLRRIAGVLMVEVGDLAGYDFPGHTDKTVEGLTDGERAWLRLYRNHPEQSNKMMRPLMGLPTDVVRDVLEASGLLVRGWLTMGKINRK